MEEAHTPKREAIERFLSGAKAHSPGWHVRVIDEQDSPIVRLQAATEESEQPKSLEIHTRQVTLTGDRIDESTRKMIERWLDSLNAGTTHPSR